jgi:HEAT repeat protein
MMTSASAPRSTPVVWSLIALLAVKGTAAAIPPAAGGKLLPAAESAAATVVGQVHNVQRLDVHGYAAHLTIERVLSNAPLNGREIQVVWEELATTRPPRFADGQRVLVSLSDFPEGSIWHQRLATAGARAFAVAATGDAFVREPDAATLDALAAYLAVPAAARDARDGVRARAHLVAAAMPAVAVSAVAQLDATPGLADKLDTTATSDLTRVIDDSHSDVSVRTALVALVAAHKLQVLRPAVVRLTEPHSPLEAPAIAALAALDGSLPPKQVRALLQRSEPAVRAAAIRGAPAVVGVKRLETLLLNETAAQVRAAAVESLLQLEGAQAVRSVLPALSDRDPTVRSVAARGIGALGEPGVAALLTAAHATPVGATTGVVLALDYAGTAGTPALRDIAANHPNEEVRTLARLALGKAPGDAH